MAPVREARPIGVLQPVARRRRRHRRRNVVVLLLVAAGAGTGAYRLASHAVSTPATASPPLSATAAPPAPLRIRPVGPLVVGPPLVRRRFRPGLSARAAIVVDARTGRVLWALRAHRRLPIASTTKIMTAVVALGRLRDGARVRVPRAVTRVPLVKEGLRPNERVPAWKLLNGLLIYSGNDDALALAVAAAGSRAAFIARMNAEARLLGLTDSHFSTPSGVIDAGNYSSAWDLAALTRHALASSRFRRIVRTRLARVPWSPPTFQKVYVNKNALLGTYRGANGVKTGWTTAAGHCLVASATRRGRTLIAVVLRAPNRYADARRLLDLGFRTRR